MCLKVNVVCVATIFSYASCITGRNALGLHFSHQSVVEKHVH